MEFWTMRKGLEIGRCGGGWWALGLWPLCVSGLGGNILYMKYSLLLPFSKLLLDVMIEV